MSPAEIRTFIRAGRAVFTIQSARTGTHFTYRVTEGEVRGDRPAPVFASVLIAPEVWAYLGVISAAGDLYATAKSRVWPGAPSFDALFWFLRQLERDELPKSVVFRHEGRCGRCARALTTPASVDTGLGPDCAEALGVPHEAHARGPSEIERDLAAYHARREYDDADAVEQGSGLRSDIAAYRSHYGD